MEITFSESFLNFFDDKSKRIDYGKVEEGSYGHWGDVASEVVAGANVFGGHGEIVHANHTNDAGFLDEGDELVAD